MTTDQPTAATDHDGRPLPDGVTEIIVETDDADLHRLGVREDLSRHPDTQLLYFVQMRLVGEWTTIAVFRWHEHAGALLRHLTHP